MGVPQIIHFDRIVHYNHLFCDTPISGNCLICKHVVLFSTDDVFEVHVAFGKHVGLNRSSSVASTHGFNVVTMWYMKPNII